MIKNRSSYPDRVLHVGDGRVELREVELGGERDREDEVPRAAPSTTAQRLPVFAVREDRSVVLPSRYRLGKENWFSSASKPFLHSNRRGIESGFY